MTTGWTGVEAAACPETLLGRLHGWILDLQDAAGNALVSYHQDYEAMRSAHPTTDAAMERLREVLERG